MKENNLFFILHSKVIIDTIEYIFIGDENCKIDLFPDVSSVLPELIREPQVVVYELNNENSYDDNLYIIKKLRSALPEFISLVAFSKNEEEIKSLGENLSLDSKPIRTLVQDNFFLDNLFNVISSEMKNQDAIQYQM